MAEEFAKVSIVRPKGCDKTALAINALDAHTRKMAWNTYLYAEGKPLLCESFKVEQDGSLTLRIKAECWAFEDAE